MFTKLKKDKAITRSIIYFTLMTIFIIVNNNVVGKFDMYSPIDNLIPFVPAFVIAYYAWYGFFFLTALHFFLHSKDDFEKTILSINLSMIIALLIYILFPNYQSLRPTVYAADFFSQTVKALQSFDSSASVLPSLHVSICLTLFLGIKESLCFKHRPKIKLFSLVIAILICMSTVFIKQHSIIDVVAGLILSLFIYFIVYKFHPSIVLAKNANKEDSAQTSAK